MCATPAVGRQRQVKILCHETVSKKLFYYYSVYVSPPFGGQRTTLKPVLALRWATSPRSVQQALEPAEPSHQCCILKTVLLVSDGSCYLVRDI